MLYLPPSLCALTPPFHHIREPVFNFLGGECDGVSVTKVCEF